MPSYIVKTVNPGDVVTVRVQHSAYGVRHNVVGKLRRVRITATGARVHTPDGKRALPGREFTHREASVFTRSGANSEPELWVESFDHLPDRKAGPALPSASPLPECCALPMRLDQGTQAWICRTESWHIRPFYPDGADPEAIARVADLLNTTLPDSRGKWYAVSDSPEKHDYAVRTSGHWREISLWLLTPLGARGVRNMTVVAPRVSKGAPVAGVALKDVAGQIAELLNSGNATGQAWWYAREYPLSPSADRSRLLARLSVSLLTEPAARAAGLL